MIRKRDCIFMGNIALREYHRKIENLIESHQIDEALSHCANILRTYPKEIETYRKLGKIFLEKQDYELSQKIFNIILSVFPDDFVANVGLSFIHESNGQMDGAIEHMLLAFELQPANPSLQDELKRLYNKRDNVEPNKIRLTRGALIKMYARSNLFEQAIAEIKLGLYEKPNRIDFKLTLADMLWKSGKHIEAVENCVDVVSQLPYCWKANEILNLAFQDLHQEQTDNNYRARLAELDPYYRYMLPTTKAVVDIPDIAEQVESDLDPDQAPTEWSDFLSKTWAVAAIPNEENASSSDLNWESILDEAGKEEIIKEEAIQETAAAGITLFEELTKNLESETPGGSKRQNFIERLQRRSQESSLGQMEAEDSSVIALPAPISAVEANAQSQPNKEEAAGDVTIEAPEIETPPEAVEPASENSKDTDEALQEPGIDLEFPSIGDESGIIDHDVPVEIPTESEAGVPASQWVRDAADAEPPADETPRLALQDTQQIRVIPSTPEETLLQSRKMIEAGNTTFALKYLQDLALDEKNLEGIRDMLEGACRDCPQESSLWLALGNIYQRLNQREKALEVLTRAQKHISL